MKSILFYSSMAACLLVVGAAAGNAQTNEMQGQLASTNEYQGQLSQTNDNRGQLSARDFKFVKAAAQGGKMEVTLGQFAAQNAQDQSVRDFGSKMVQDHQAINEQLTQLLTQKGASVSDAPGWWSEKKLSHLQGLKGSEFDQAYIKHMVSDHKDDIKEFQKESENGDDGDVKNFASKALPTLQKHLQMAEDIQSKLSATASNQ